MSVLPRSVTMYAAYDMRRAGQGGTWNLSKVLLLRNFMVAVLFELDPS